jgi:hypothetical protein
MTSGLTGELTAEISQVGGDGYLQVIWSGTYPPGAQVTIAVEENTGGGYAPFGQIYIGFFSDGINIWGDNAVTPGASYRAHFTITAGPTYELGPYIGV